jgi:hypothetical protein
VSGVYSAKLSLNLTGEHFRIETGIGAEVSLASLYYECQTKETSVSHNEQGNTVVFNPGTAVELDFEREDIFWGLYLQASYIY